MLSLGHPQDFGTLIRPPFWIYFLYYVLHCSFHPISTKIFPFFHHGADRKHVLFPAARKNKLPKKALKITNEAYKGVCTFATVLERCVCSNNK